MNGRNPGQIAYEAFAWAHGMASCWPEMPHEDRARWEEVAGAVLRSGIPAADVDHIVLTKRQLKEIGYCMIYARDYGHGTDGHNLRMLVSVLAGACGIRLAVHPSGREGLDMPPWIDLASDGGDA